MANFTWARWIVLRIWQSTLAQFIICMFICVGLYMYYNSHNVSTFTTINETYRNNRVQDEQVDKNGNLLSVSKDEVVKSGKRDRSIDVVITFTKTEHNVKLQQKFTTMVQSLFKFTTVPVNVHILGDEYSQKIASSKLAEVADKSMYKIIHHNVEDLAKEVSNIISHMQSFFTYKPGAQYSDAFYFISIVSHRLLPTLDRVIMLDCDLKFNEDLKNLYDLFDEFSEDNVIGIGQELQPTYRHSFYYFRKDNKGTRVGEPPPDGLSGFNSGVLLLDLERMRKSDLYNSLISDDVLRTFTKKYKFKGNLGDQDFFTLVSMEHEELFYTLPCTWNRQLCQFWKNNGYEQVASQYFACEGHINIYHGNCNTEIPKLDWEN